MALKGNQQETSQFVELKVLLDVCFCVAKVSQVLIARATFPYSVLIQPRALLT